MSESHHFTATPPGHAHGDHHGAEDLLARFSEPEWTAFHAADQKAGAAIVMLVSGIFAIGVFLYAIVAWSCM